MDNLVSKPTQDALMELIKQSFTLNRVFDRLVSYMGVKFAMNQTAELLHGGYAHLYLHLADVFGARCLESYNIPVVYGETPKADEEYSSVKECIEVLESKVVDYQALMMGVCKIAFNHDDIHVYADMLDVLKDYNLYVAQAILLKDKIEVYGNNIAAYDHDVKDFWILKEAY